MKRFLAKITPIVLIALVVILAGGRDAMAEEGAILKFLGFNLPDLIAQGLASVTNIILSVAGFVLALSGTLLNFSINLTLNIKSFVNQTEAIYTTWRAIRDITGMFIIGALLFAAFQLILGLGGNFKKLIVDIVFAGVLINFSFFIASLGIDASNVVSAQLYRAIAPASALRGNLTDVAKSSELLADGGLSAVFMQSLQITRLYKPEIILDSSDGTVQQNAGSGIGYWNRPLKVVMVGIVGTVIMWTASLSFAVAALAFIMRFVILIFLLAFSPIWLASYIVPKLKEYGSEWTKKYTSMLLFMPAYLLLMYVAMSVLSSSTFLTSLSAPVGSKWYNELMILAINSTIVIFLLNTPLLVAISLGGISQKIGAKIGAENVWKKFGGWAKGRTVASAGSTWRNTGGALASKANNSAAMRSFYAKRPNLGRWVGSSISKTAKGYDKAQGEKEKAAKEWNKKIGKVDRSAYGSDEKGKKAYEEAVERAKEYQQTHRQAITNPTIMGKLFTSRGAKRAGYEMEKKAKDENDKKEAKKAKKRLEEIARQKKDLAEPSSLVLSGKLSEEVARNKQQKLAELEKEEEELRQAIDKAAEIEEKDKEERFLSEIEKRVGKSEGDKKGGDKK